MTASEMATINAKILDGDLTAAVEELLLHVKLLYARIDDLRRELRTEGTRRAILNGPERRR